MNNNNYQELCLFGASTAPYAKSKDWPMEEWSKDLETMRELNFNSARIFAAWDRIERVEGEFDYSKQDYFVEMAKKHEINVIMHLGGVFAGLCGIYPPRWLKESYDCQGRWETPTKHNDNDSLKYFFCPDDPVYREKAFAFMKRTVKRYADQDAIVAWMNWNEPGMPMCYCPHTVTRFREWLKETYDGDLQKLNTVWGTEFPVDFKDWNKIPVPTDSGVLNPWRDWLLFNQYRLYSVMGEMERLINENDPMNRPVTANMVYHHTAMELGISGAELGFDIGRIGQTMTLMGVSCYTMTHQDDIHPAYKTAYKLSRLRSASKDTDRRMWVLETEAGPNLRQLTDARRKQTFYHLIAHNVKSILVWNYRSRLSDGQVALFHMLNWDGSVTERARRIGDFAKIMCDNAALINSVFPERHAAVLTTEEQQVLNYALYGKNKYEKIHDSRFGAYKLLWDLNIPTDCIAENNLDEMNQYKIILLPMMEHMSAELADRLRKYVESGGTLIAESPLAFKDTDNLLQYKAPGFGLDEVFGCFTKDRQCVETASEIICPTGKANTHFFHQLYEPIGGEVLASYESAGAAVVKNTYGKGTTILAGTEVFRQYMADPQQAMSALLRNEILASGVQRTARIFIDDQDTVSSDVEVARLSGPGGELYLISNHSDCRTVFRVELLTDGPWMNIENGVEFNPEVELALDAKEVLAISQKL